MNKVKRPILRYHGGKWMLAPWIISHFPAHRVYTEAFGGAASVLLRKPRSYAEVYNDLDGEIVNLFRVLRNPAQARELARLVRLTPYSRDEFEASYLSDGDPIEQARRTLFRSAAGFSTAGNNGASEYRTGFRSNVTRNGGTPARDWMSVPAVIEQVVARLQGVVIEHDAALRVLTRYDASDTLHYIDPPYVPETRNRRHVGNVYAVDMDIDGHRALAGTVRGLKGMVILSGYHCELYADLYADWQMVTRETHADSALDRTEVLWIKPGASLPGLFGIGA